MRCNTPPSQTVQKLIELGASDNTSGKESAFFGACQGGCIELVEKIIVLRKISGAISWAAQVNFDYGYVSHKFLKKAEGLVLREFTLFDRVLSLARAPPFSIPTNSRVGTLDPSGK